MDRSLFTDQIPGQLVRIDFPLKDWAFLPDPIPSDWEMPADLWPYLMEAREAIKELNGIGRHIQNHNLLLRPLQQREALRSSSMEGTYATPEELLLYQAEDKNPDKESERENDWREVSNYGAALTLGQHMLDDGIPISLHLIKSLHAELLKGVRGENKNPGRFREHQVHVGAGGRYIPPPPLEVQSCLTAFQDSLAGENTYDPLIWSFMVHYQFETIHPFGDGNGRVGRLLLSLMIYQMMELSHPWLYMSSFFEKHKDEYINGMFDVSSKNNWEKWIKFCLIGAAEQAKDSIARLDRFVAIKDEFHGRLTGTNASVRHNEIIDYLFERPVITAPHIETKFGVTYPTARQDITRLLDMGILSEGPAHMRPRYYFAPEIMAIAYGDLT